MDFHADRQVAAFLAGCSFNFPSVTAHEEAA
jgi:hypothetical protein